MADEKDDIERLKVHKIHPDTASHVFLPQLGRAHASSEPVNEVTWSSGEKPTEDVAADVLRERIVTALKTVFDPEIPVNIYDLGLIYDIKVVNGGDVDVKMTLTAPACPVAGMLVQEVAEKVGRVPGVAKSHVELVWEPPWTQDRMTEAAKLELGLL